MEDEEDYEAFLEGVTFFLRLTVEQMKEHLDLHPEDGFAMIRHPGGRGSALCTKLGWDRMRNIVDRRLASLPDGKDMDVEEVLQEISELIAPSLDEGVKKGESAEQIFECVYASALRNVEANKHDHIYHFPCVLAGAASPEQFTLGPVRFAIASVFEAELASMASRDFEIEEQIKEKEFIDYLRQFGWVVSVTIPQCSRRIALQRAELAARTAINVVRAWFGLEYGKRMRLVHAEPATSSFTKFVVQSNKEISLSWTRKSEGASVIDGWFSQVRGRTSKARLMAFEGYRLC